MKSLKTNRIEKKQAAITVTINCNRNCKTIQLNRFKKRNKAKIFILKSNWINILT